MHYAKYPVGLELPALVAVGAVPPGKTLSRLHRSEHFRMTPYDSHRQPPCWPSDGTRPNLCALAHADHILRNHVDLHGPWAGWRLAGRDLVSPEGQRLSEGRLRGLVWRDENEQRLARIRARKANSGHRGMVTVVRMPLHDWHLERFGSRAG